MILVRLPALACSVIMQSSHLLHLFAAPLGRNHCHATHLFHCSYIQPSDRQTVPDFWKHLFTPQPSPWFIQPEPAFKPAWIHCQGDNHSSVFQPKLQLTSPEVLDHIFWVLLLFSQTEKNGETSLYWEGSSWRAFTRRRSRSVSSDTGKYLSGFYSED
ncbi:hypothetical protein AMECASPLE_023345 [Ameca splendens]|uniref:Secreted protein n=1 Tax=Ameca splendens TaxID=208324 RepID=A0ABV0ZPL6_9TELE